MRTIAPEDLYLPTPRLNELHILEQVAGNPGITQAELADRCALSVAMVNNYMKGLQQQGSLEYRRRNSKSISYHLTDAGREAVDATRGILLAEMVRFFESAKEQVREMVLNRARSCPRHVVLYGSGPLAELAAHALESSGIRILGVCPGSTPSHASGCGSAAILSPAEIRTLAPDAVVIALPPESDDLDPALACELRDFGLDVIPLYPCRTDRDKAGAEPREHAAAITAG